MHEGRVQLMHASLNNPIKLISRKFLLDEQRLSPLPIELQDASELVTSPKDKHITGLVVIRVLELIARRRTLMLQKPPPPPFSPRTEIKSFRMQNKTITTNLQINVQINQQRIDVRTKVLLSLCSSIFLSTLASTGADYVKPQQVNSSGVTCLFSPSLL